MAAYKDRVAQDLDRWIAAGLVPEASRTEILAGLPDARRMDAASALAWVGGVLLGLALVAFISANWDALPRIARFVFVIGVFACSAGGAAWCSEHKRPHLANGLLTFAALAFSAALGLSGQIFDITGDSRTALYAAGVVAAALGVAGGASGPLVAALLFFGLADFVPDGANQLAGPFDLPVPALVLAAPAAAGLAIRWRSTALAHAAAIAMVGLALWGCLKLDAHGGVFLAATALLAALAWGGRQLGQRDQPAGPVFYGWFVWAAFATFIAAGASYDIGPNSGDGHTSLDLAHRIGWLAGGGGAIALGRHDRHALVTAAGVLGMLGAVSGLLIVFGANLLTAAGVFLLLAIVAVTAGLILRRRAK